MSRLERYREQVADRRRVCLYCEHFCDPAPPVECGGVRIYKGRCWIKSKTNIAIYVESDRPVCNYFLAVNYTRWE